MGKQKIDGGTKPYSFTLTEEDVKLLEHYSNLEGVSRSRFMGWLIRRYHQNTDPFKNLEEIKNKKVELSKEITRLEEEESKVLEDIKYFTEKNKEKEKIKLDAVKTIKRKLREGTNIIEIENIARNWAFRLNIDKDELLFKAMKEIKLEKDL